MFEKYCLVIEIGRSFMYDIICLLAVIILCVVLILLWIIIVDIPKAFHPHKFKKQNNIKSLIPLIDEQLEEYNKMFALNRTVSDEEVEKYLSDNKGLIYCVRRLYTSKPSIYNEYLDSTSIKTYKELITPYKVKLRQKESNEANSTSIETPVESQNPISGFQRTVPFPQPTPETTEISDDLPF